MKIFHATIASSVFVVVLLLANMLSWGMNMEADKFKITHRLAQPDLAHGRIGAQPTSFCTTLGVHGYMYTKNQAENRSTDYDQHHNSSHVFQIHVITMERAASLRSLLTSLEQANYDGDTVELYIHIDKSASNTGCVQTVKDFRFSHGSVCYLLSTTNMGLRNSWFNAWYPVKNQRAIILEDDIVVSIDWYLWLKSAWNSYGHRKDLAGISLQRQVLVPQKPHKNMEIVNQHRPFLYKLVGSIGFSPHWKVWMSFLKWIQSVDLRTVNVRMRSLITSDWHYRNDKRQMWTHYFIWFCEQHDLYTLYVNLPGGVAIGTHMRESGEHHTGSLGPDFPTATHIRLDFPDVLWKYGWDANPIYPAMYNDANRKIMATLPTASKQISRRMTNTSAISMAESMNTRRGFVNMQILNTGYITMTKSWICNVRVFPGVLENTLFVATDENTYAQLRSFDRSLHVAFEKFNSSTTLRYGQYAYYRFILFRTTLVLDLLYRGTVVWITESDAVWWQDPTAIVMNTTGDIVAMNDVLSPGKQIQGGFLLLRPSTATLRVWKMMLDTTHNIMRMAQKNSEMQNAGNEQVVLSDLVSKSPDVNLQWLDATLFISGLYYQKDTVVTRIKHWALFSNQTYNQIVVLNNFIVGNVAKQQRARKWKHWFLSAEETCIVNI